MNAVLGFLTLRGMRPNPSPRSEHERDTPNAPETERPHLRAERRFNTKRDLSWADKN